MVQQQMSSSSSSRREVQVANWPLLRHGGAAPAALPVKSTPRPPLPTQKTLARPQSTVIGVLSESPEYLTYPNQSLTP